LDFSNDSFTRILVVPLKLNHVEINVVLAHLLHKLGLFAGMFLRPVARQPIRHSKLSTKRSQSVACLALSIHRVNRGKVSTISEHSTVPISVLAGSTTIQSVSEPFAAQSALLKDSVSAISSRERHDG
jgi:hypothetical protein